MKATLPLPPSVNAMYRHFGHTVYKTQEAKAWIREASFLLKAAPFKDKVAVNIDYYFKRDSDIDNRIKALLDLLQSKGIITNDNQVYRLVVTKNFDKKNPRVELSISDFIPEQ